MTTQTGAAYLTCYHRDGTVTLWSTYEQVWLRLPAKHVSAETLATLSHAERARIERMVAGPY